MTETKTEDWDIHNYDNSNGSVEVYVVRIANIIMTFKRRYLHQQTVSNKIIWKSSTGFRHDWVRDFRENKMLTILIQQKYSLCVYDGEQWVMTCKNDFNILISILNL